jgi:hypothetical protein
MFPRNPLRLATKRNMNNEIATDEMVMKHLMNCFARMSEEEASNKYTQMFKIVCGEGMLHSAQLMLKARPNIDISSRNEETFRWVCANGRLEVAKWLLEVKPDIHISVHDNAAFRYACEDGVLEVAKWLLEVKPDIDISANGEAMFRRVCANGRLEVAKWLLEVKPNINISAMDESAFRWACENGHLEVAQWLLEVKPDINISAMDDGAFRWACEKKQLAVARWLVGVCKPNYEIVGVLPDGKIQFEVRVKLPISTEKSVVVSESDMEVDCPICCSAHVDIESVCGHRFCMSCVQSWIANRRRNNLPADCPCCRNAMSVFYRMEIAGGAGEANFC